jgi:hypothetical protein
LRSWARGTARLRGSFASKAKTRHM